MHSQFRNDNLVVICCNHNNGSVAQLNRALDYGSRGYRFESCRNHKRNTRESVPFFCSLTFEYWPLTFMICALSNYLWTILSFELWTLNFDLYDLCFEYWTLSFMMWVLTLDLPVAFSDKVQLTVVIIIMNSELWILN